MMQHPIRVLFLCTGNSARSQMAEGLLRTYGDNDFEVYSAGTEPKEVHPLAIQVMKDIKIDISNQKCKHLAQFENKLFDYVITVCDRVNDNCPTFPGDNERIHWSYDDPAEVIDDLDLQYQKFKRIRNEISERLRIWIAVQRKNLKDIGVK